MSVYDYIVIGVYLVFMLALGPIYKSFSKTASDYFRGGGGMLWWVVGSSAFMTSFSAWSFTGGAAKAYETGTFFLLLFICNIIATIVCLVFTAHRFRQLRVISPVEAIRNRFGATSEQIFTWLPLFFQIFFGGVMLYTISVFMSGVFDMEMIPIILILGTVMIVMTLVGGSWAATAGDFVQMLVVLMITIIMACLTLNHEAIGGIGGLIDKMPSYHFTWTEFARPSVIVVFTLTLLINQIIFANSMQSGAIRYIFVKDGKDARKSAWVSVIGFLLLPSIWIIPALGAAIIFPNLGSMYPQLNNPNEAAYVAIAIELLPQGLLGLLVCGIFAASLTSMNSLLNMFSSSFVRNFYIRIIEKGASESKQIFVGRIFVLVYGGIWMLGAIGFSTIKSLQLFDLILLASASLGLPSALPMAMGMFIKKTPKWAGWSSMVAGFIASIAARFLFTHEFMQNIWGDGVPLTARELGDLNIALTTGLVFSASFFWFLFSMLFYKGSSPEYVKDVDDFFEVMNKPIDRATELDNENESDRRQYAVLSNLCIAYGVLTLLLLAVPNDMNARLLILVCGGVVALVGVFLRFVAKKKGEATTS